MNSEQLQADALVLLESRQINEKLTANLYTDESGEQYVGLIHHKFTEEVLLLRESLESVLDFVVDFSLKGKV